MIKKELKKSRKIAVLEALLRRLPEHHVSRPKITSELAMAMAGYRGEQSLDYYFGFLQKEKYYILHDIRLPYDETRYFQIDILLLSAQFMLIIEVKNLSGTLYFDGTFNQLVRTQNGVEEVFKDPISQVHLQKLQLEAFLKANKIHLPPIETLVAFTHPTALIQTSPNNKSAQQYVIKSINLIQKISHFEKIYNKEGLNSKELKSLLRLCLKNHCPSNQDLLLLFNITQNEILTGVHCPHCSYLPMIRKYGEWLCQNCLSSSKNAHVTALQDYFLLINNTITNKQLRYFLQLQSPTIASRLLTSMNLKSTGYRKYRIYKLDWL